MWPMTAMGSFPLQFLIKIIEIWPMAAMGNFLYNSLSKSLKCDLWKLWAISITSPYQNHWNVSYDTYGPFPLQFLIQIIEIWPMAAMGHFLYNSLYKSLIYDLWQLRAISFQFLIKIIQNLTCGSYGPFPLQFLIKIIEIWPRTATCNFLYNSLSKSLKYDLWQLWAISITIPYQNHWNMAYDSYGAFPLQFLIKIIEIWPMTAMGNFL